MFDEEPQSKRYWQFRHLDELIVTTIRDNEELKRKIPSDVDDPYIRSMLTEFAQFVSDYALMFKHLLRRTPEINKENYKKYINNEQT